MPTTTPLAAPCKDCRTRGGSRNGNRDIPSRRRGYCNKCYNRHLKSRDITFGPQIGGWNAVMTAIHPSPLPRIITPAMLGITGDDIAERAHAAKMRRLTEESQALYFGLDWREAHSEQFTPAAIAALYPDPAGLACSAWADDAASRAA